MSRQHVLALLDAHSPADPEEARAVRTVRRVLRETPTAHDLFDKRQTTPGHFTASAIATNPARTHLLLIHHPAFGLWIQPGGHTDATDASLPAAAARELEEETGLGPTLARPLGLLDVAVHEVPAGIKGQDAHLHLDLRFGFSVPLDAPLAGEARTPARWTAITALDTIATDNSVRAAARRLRKP